MKKALLLWALIATSQHSSITFATESARTNTPAIEYKKTIKYDYLSIGLKAFVLLGITAAISKVQNVLPMLDQQRPVTCVDVYQSCLPDWITKQRICTHLDEPFYPTLYDRLPSSLREKCTYPHGPDNPQKLTDQEQQALQLREYCQRGTPIQAISLICRYRPHQ